MYTKYSHTKQLGTDFQSLREPAADFYTANLVVNEGDPVYDFCWYPYMFASDPVTCVFASTTRDHPINLWDDTSGEVI
ncbi:unnamed protein product [Camellia sinensis]